MLETVGLSIVIETSVVIPAFAANEEALQQLADCLAAIQRSVADGLEVLVVDDASPQLGPKVEALALAHGARYLRTETQAGPGLARNLGVAESSGAALLFFDADTVVHADTIARLLSRLREGHAAVIGSYDDQPRAAGVVSRFRNLLHCYVHHSSAGSVQTFWTGCGAVRREWFVKLGGFSRRYTVPSIEDVELGYRMTAAGGKIWLDPAAQVTHLKLWTLRSMVQTDLWKRAVPWAQLLKEHPLPGGLNFSWKDRLAALCVALILPIPLLIWLKWGLLRFLYQRGGLLFAAQCFILLVIHLGTAILGLVIGRLKG
jgi:GT2 family glycosyltransferase